MLVLLFIPFLGGCFQGASFGDPGVGSLKGRVALPPCVVSSPEQGIVLAYNERGEAFQAFLEQDGSFSIPSFSGSSCLVYVRWKDMQLAGGFHPLRAHTLNDLGEINAYTTSQVLIYEAAHRLYPQAVYIRDIPHFLPPEHFVSLVRETLLSCRNPFASPEVEEAVREILNVSF